MGLGLIDIDSHNCMMLRAHQTPGNFELKKRNMTPADHYIAVIKRYRRELLKLSHLVVADAFFSSIIRIVKRDQGHDEGKANGVFHVQLQVADDQNVPDETNF